MKHRRMGQTIARRDLLVGAAGLALGACSRSQPSPPTGTDSWRELSFEPGEDAPEGQRALVMAPTAARPLPLLVALHGRGESGRGLDAGARGWRDDYELPKIHERLRSPPLVRGDLQNMVRPERLALLNGSLSETPYEGLCVACPYTPDLQDRTVEGSRGFARFLLERLLPRVRSEVGASRDRAMTGIDGVSMGGRLALLVGLTHPEVFGAVGALQPALRADDADMLLALARSAMERAEVKLRMVSSEADPFLPAIRTVSTRLREGGVVHEFLIVPGPHNYAWNRGPGGAEMLLWHERVLRGLRAP